MKHRGFRTPRSPILIFRPAGTDIWCGSRRNKGWKALCVGALAAVVLSAWLGAGFLTRGHRADAQKRLEPLEQWVSQEAGALMQPRPAHSVEIDEANIWELFQDYVLLGDSRAVGFSMYDFLEDSRVLAGGGHTIRQIQEQLEAAVALQPQTVFLCYGINDVGIGFWDTPQEYADELMQTISGLQARLPGATVVVSSILPAQGAAFDLNPDWYNIPAFNDAVAAACQEKGIPYADNASISAAHPGLWQPDGIHLCPEFYPYWAENLIQAAGPAN